MFIIKLKVNFSINKLYELACNTIINIKFLTYNTIELLNNCFCFIILFFYKVQSDLWTFLFIRLVEENHQELKDANWVRLQVAHLIVVIKAVIIISNYEFISSVALHHTIQYVICPIASRFVQNKYKKNSPIIHPFIRHTA